MTSSKFMLKIFHKQDKLANQAKRTREELNPNKTEDKKAMLAHCIMPNLKVFNYIHLCCFFEYDCFKRLSLVFQPCLDMSSTKQMLPETLKTKRNT